MTDRYGMAPAGSHGCYVIFDKTQGRNHTIGVIHSATLAQQVVDDLNEHAAHMADLEAAKQAEAQP